MDNNLAPENSSALNQTATPSQNKGLGKKIVFIAMVAVLVVGVALLGYYGIDQREAVKQANIQIASLETKNQNTEKELKTIKESTGEENIDKNASQAVFFKTGKVYFGKITKITPAQITLENIYYLQVGTEGKPDLKNLPADAQLIKLGNELHKPQDAMYIERGEVEFWENLTSDGAVAKAIAEYEKANPKPAN